MIDIHLHIDGSISLANAKKLLTLEGKQIPSDEELHDKLFTHDGSRDLNEYLARFEYPAELLQTSEQIETCVFTLAEELHELGLRYAELRFAPQRSTWRGLSQEAVFDAACAGLARSQLRGRLILCCMRGDDNEAANIETIELASDYLDKGVCAVDLAGAEALFPTEDFTHLFARAEALSVPFTIHAGEATGPSSVRAALDCGTRRIGHGVRAAEDPALLKELAREQIVCELCPTSNLNTGVFASYEDFPLPAFLEAGVPITINADNMSVSNTNVARELELMTKTFSLDADVLASFERNAISALFASDGVKADLLQELESA